MSNPPPPRKRRLKKVSGFGSPGLADRGSRIVDRETDVRAGARRGPDADRWPSGGADPTPMNGFPGAGVGKDGEWSGS